ncbi:MAG: hypothetical protein LBC43_01415 [Bifidobacteriaceae bacterium]|jgi:UDP-N-acetylmuramoyl-L-alanyl-D-glutamate--2,6-diaminopimelate ligase|nr:hypothetical protein [Bifidobacteriaceae bacterium]
MHHSDAGSIKTKSRQDDSLEWQSFYQHPERKLQLIGITGTDGKTTTASIVQYLLGDSECGYIGTNGVKMAGYVEDIANTTPVPKSLYRILDQFVQHGATSAVLELSSEGKVAGRLNDLTFSVVGLTNITSEHLNTHKTWENYLAAKIAILVDQIEPQGAAVLNADDQHYFEVSQQLQQRRPDVQQFTYGFASSTTTTAPVLTTTTTSSSSSTTSSTTTAAATTIITAETNSFVIDPSVSSSTEADQNYALDIEYDELSNSTCNLMDQKYTLCIMNYEFANGHTLIRFKFGGRTYAVDSPLLGKYNVENLICAFLSVYALKARFLTTVLGKLEEEPPSLPASLIKGEFCSESATVADAFTKDLSHLHIPGRLEIFKTENSPTIIVDYAHTPNGITKLFEALPALGEFEHIYSVSGQAGSRDSSKRPEVGRLLAEKSTQVFFTTEDPHWEDYDNVLKDLTSLVTTSNYQIVLDRYLAIQKALEIAESQDLVLVLGKGVETTHDFKGVAVPFSDIDTVKTLLKY